MRRSLTYILFADVIFIVLLSVSSIFGGALGEILYYGAFILPLILAYALVKSSNSEYVLPKLKISGQNALLLLPVVFPFLALVFLISWLTSLLLSLLAEAPVTDVSGNIFAEAALHALIPAVLEEALFRFLPLALIAPHSKKNAVLISAVLFSLIHLNLFQIPYAFFAGIVFALLDLMLDSILPSVILHFLNNLVSVIWMRSQTGELFSLLFPIILAVGAVLSLILIFVIRNKYKSGVSGILSDKSRVLISGELFAVCLMLLLSAVINLLWV